LKNVYLIQNKFLTSTVFTLSSGFLNTSGIILLNNTTSIELIFINALPHIVKLLIYRSKAAVARGTIVILNMQAQKILILMKYLANRIYSISLQSNSGL